MGEVIYFPTPPKNEQPFNERLLDYLDLLRQLVLDGEISNIAIVGMSSEHCVVTMIDNQDADEGGVDLSLDLCNILYSEISSRKGTYDFESTG